MIDIQQLIKWDKELLLTLNGSDSLFWDGFMWVYTGMWVWIPLALTLLYVIIRNNKLKETLLIIVMLSLVILLADRISSGFFKPFFHRFRPTHDPEIMNLVDVVNGYRGGKYGFVSSHAANSFGIITFLALLIKRRAFTLAVVAWALLNCYSRIYLGVHFPGDILCGTILGCLVGYVVYGIYRLMQNKYFPKRDYRFSSQYTRSGYRISDINISLIVLLSSILLVIISGAFLAVCKF